jgi:hypothetical protein
MQVMQLSCRMLAASYNKIKNFFFSLSETEGVCFIFRKSFLFYMDVLATGKLQTPNPRAQPKIQTPIFSPPLLEKQKKILDQNLQTASNNKER